MKILFLFLLILIFIGAVIAMYLVKKEQDNRIGNKFLHLIRKFDSWQMMR
ncbi:LemA protein [Chitinophaga sp. 180180018-2]|nr:LemA protein [Chitinophaga sp. 212800010-3]